VARFDVQAQHQTTSPPANPPLLQQAQRQADLAVDRGAPAQLNLASLGPDGGRDDDELQAWMAIPQGAP
jgi:hypothetical protein